MHYSHLQLTCAILIFFFLCHDLARWSGQCALEISGAADVYWAFPRFTCAVWNVPLCFFTLLTWYCTLEGQKWEEEWFLSPAQLNSAREGKKEQWSLEQGCTTVGTAKPCWLVEVGVHVVATVSNRQFCCMYVVHWRESGLLATNCGHFGRVL